MAFSPEQFQAEANVPRETMERLSLYAALLEKWQKTVNLVGPKTLPDIWQRHFLDSAQLWPLITRTDSGQSRCFADSCFVDLGSGAGFPGLVLAILGAPEMHLFESDQRKCAFLREAARVTGAKVEIHAERIEKAKPFPADVITARALAPLEALLDLAAPFCGQNTRLIFLKGQDVDDELTKATKYRKFSVERHPSRADPRGSVLIITGLDHDRRDQS